MVTRTEKAAKMPGVTTQKSPAISPAPRVPESTVEPDRRSPGSRQLKVVYVAESHADGIGGTAETDHEVIYDGETVTVKP
jgi:hypothetical protein